MLAELVAIDSATSKDISDPVRSFFSWKQSRHPSVDDAVIDSYTYVKRRQRFTIATPAEWGAANDSARQVVLLFKLKYPDHVCRRGYPVCWHESGISRRRRHMVPVPPKWELSTRSQIRDQRKPRWFGEFNYF